MKYLVTKRTQAMLHGDLGTSPDDPVPQHKQAFAGIYEAEGDRRLVALLDSPETAQLFAAAPELLEACEYALDHFRAVGQTSGGTYEHIKRVVASVGGRV